VTAYYHTKKYGEFDNQTFQEYVDQFKILTISAKTLSIAYDLAGKSNDLEDAIQIAACKQAKIETFVTADKEIAKLYCNELNIELVE
jgi:predicted nucleic acid-binding protein